MATDFDALSREVMVLPADQRIALAHQLLSSVETEPDPQADAAWEQEIIRRIAQSDAGESASVPAAEVFARLDRLVASSAEAIAPEIEHAHLAEVRRRIARVEAGEMPLIPDELVLTEGRAVLASLAGEQRER